MRVMRVMRVGAFVLLALLGCSSGAESFGSDASYDAGRDVLHRDATVDVQRDAPRDTIHDVEAECVPLIGSWPCSPILWEATTLDVGAVNVESGLPRTYVTSDLSVAGSSVLVADAGLLSKNLPGLIDASGDPNGAYVVLAAAGALDPGVACVWYCGFHESTDAGLRYAVVVDTGSSTCAACSAFPNTDTPNGSLSADTMVSVIAHELAEMVTDPDPYTGWNTWLNSEVGDVCAWSFGDTYGTPPYNVEVGGGRYLVQRIWGLGGLGCTLGPQDFDAAVLDSGVLDYPAGGDPMLYYGGKVFDRPMHVYWLWLGAWSNRNVVEPILTSFVNGLGASGWWKAPAGYFSEPALLDGGVDGGGG